jgi:hypothetical protein
MNRKGYVYTVISMMLALVLLAVVSLYYESYKAATDISPAKLRTDELHYFVESAKKDLGRSMSISARRGAAYMTDYVINNHTVLPDPNGTLKQLMVNGTMTVGASTFIVTYMQNQTLSTFISSLQTTGSDLRFRTNVSIRAIDVYMYDSLHFMVVAKYNFSIADRDTAEGGVCGYENENQTLYVLVPIDGLEDPLYAYKTTSKVSRIYNHSTQGGIQVLASGAMGNGTGGGMVVDLSLLSVANQEDGIFHYNESNSTLVPYTVFVLNLTYAQLNSFGLDQLKVLNQSAGSINYVSEAMIDNGFPYVSGVPGKLNFSDKDYVIIRNGNEHQILYLWMANDIKNRLYANSTNGSCFFDRLKGNANLTAPYRTQAAYARMLLGQPNTASVGIESYVNMSDLNSSGLYPSITPYENYSSIDYLYFQQMPGKWVYGTPYWFRMDAYSLNTTNLTDYCYDNYAGVWHFDESYDLGGDTYTYDGSRYANHLKLSPGTSIDSNGKRGTCLSVWGNDPDYAEANVNVSELAYTLSMWVKVDPLCTDCGIFSTDDGTDGVHDRDLYIKSGTLCALLKNPGNDEICTGSAYNDDQWHHVVHVFENTGSGGQRLYVDGSLKIGGPGSARNSTMTSQSRIRVGHSEEAPVGNKGLIGMIDDLKIWNRALAESEIVDEYEKLK